MIKPTLKIGATLGSGLVLTAILAMTSLCQSQTTNDESSEAITTTAVNEKSANVITPNWSRVLKDYVLLPTPMPDPQVTGPTGPTPTAQVSDRVKVREYMAPWWRDTYASIRFGPKHINAVVGGFDQGSGLGLGIEFTTADKFSWVELRAMALTSTILFRRAKLEAYFPSVGSERNHASVWFNYLLATRWNFFGVGPRTPLVTRTSFQLEQRGYNGFFQRDFTGILRAGVYAGVANAGATNGNNDNVANINMFFSGLPTTVPITSFAPGLNMNTEISYYGAYGEYDRRNNNRGLTRGFYL